MNAPPTIADAAAALRRGGTTPVELTTDCLQRIARFEPELAAWVSYDAEAALRDAELRAEELAAGRPRGPLHGIPIGVKDIIDVAGLPTRAGSRLTSDVPAASDAFVVARLRAAGAIVLGKTVTTEFACFDPSPAKNPWNALHTPGGSSSGSAVAVAAGMCLAALGTQTGGSINRPASYCGVAGCKPTFGRVSRHGVTPVSFHLDHVGPLARTATDCGLILAALAGDDPADPACSVRPGIELPDDRPWHAERAPRLGLVRDYFLDQADDTVRGAFQSALGQLVEHGAKLVELELPEYFREVHAMHRRLMAAEAADFHRRAFGAPRPGYGPQMQALLDEGFSVTLAEYQTALRHRLAFRNAVQRLLTDVDALVLPATPAPPPDCSTTGDARFNVPWSHAGVPAVSLPCGLTTAGLPVALQLVGETWSEEWLLPTAAWCERMLGFRAVPALLAQ